MDDREARRLEERAEEASELDSVLRERAAARFLSLAASTLAAWRRLTRQTGKLHGPQWVQLSQNRVGYRKRALIEYVERREGGAEMGGGGE